MSAREYLIGCLTYMQRGGKLSDIEATADEALSQGRSEALNEAADMVYGAFHGEPFLNYPPDFADLLREKATTGQATASQPETAPECRECEHPAHRPSECTEQRDGDDRACSAGQTPESQPETAPDAPAVGDRYDCRHGGEGVTVTRLWALNNGHRAVDFEYHDGESSALPLDSFRRAYRPEAAPDGDEWVRCSGLHCPNAERFAKATERGWQPGGMGTWQCPTCATGAES